MALCLYNSVHVESMGSLYPEFELTSSAIEDRIAPVYERLGIPFGTLERLSGVKSRWMWDPSIMPSQVGSQAVAKALAEAGLEPSEIEALVSCSVCRDLFEPATACIMHDRLGLPKSTFAFDVTNACIGFSNGLIIAANLIESGFIKRAVVVSAENPAIILEGNFRHIREKESSISREELIRVLPTFTLGCGAIAYVLAHESVAKSPIKYLGAVAEVASEHAGLCGGNGDFCLHPSIQDPEKFPLMETESSKLIEAAARLGGEVWPKLASALKWSNEMVDHVVCHQVGRQVNADFYSKMDLPFEKDFAIYRNFGNMVSAAMPSALMMAIEGRKIKAGDRVVSTAFGSGLNAVFSGFQW